MELHLGSMENITCWAFRNLIQGVTDSYTGVLSLNYILHKKNWKEVDLYQSNQKQWIQIATSSPEECKKFVERLQREQKEKPEKYNVYGIQLNCSCPSFNLIKLGHGPALISKPHKIVEMLKELKKSPYKIGIKVRLGLNEQEVKQEKLFQLLPELEKLSLEHVVIHFKHAKEPSYTKYDYSLLKRISNYKLRIVINGGINSYQDFMKIIQPIQNKSNIVGFMMAREALKNPNCFIESSKILNHKDFKAKSSEQVKKEFEDNCKTHLPKQGYVRAIEKYCSWAKGLKIEFPEEQR